MSFSLADLDLPWRAYQRLKAAGVSSLDELTGWSKEELLALPGFGATSLAAVTLSLALHGMALKENPPPARQRPLKFTAEMKREAERLYRLGYGTPELGERFGVSRAWVHHHLRSKGLMRPKADTEALQRLRREGEAIRAAWMSATEAARHLGLDKSHVCALLRAGRFPGAFQLGEGRQAPWLVPRSSVEAYREPKPKPSGSG